MEKSLVRLVAFLLLFCHILDAEYICPTPTQCYCFHNREVDCLNFDLRSIPHFEPKNHTFEAIDLGQNRFRTIPANAFRHLRVKELYVWENRRNITVDRDAFNGLGEYLEYLQLKDNREITSLPRGLFRSMSKLVALELQHNRLRFLQPFSFKGALSLEHLDLAKNHLTYLQDHTFRGLFALTELKLSANDIKYISAKAFLGLHSLLKLKLDRNAIRDLQPRTFRRLEKLTELDLSSNNMSAIFPLMFKGLRQLQTLDLTNNPIELIADSTFATMESLTELVIDKTKLSHLRPGMFRGLKNLRELSLYHNNIHDISDDLFLGLPSLWKLYLDYNHLQTVNPCAFDNIENLKMISVTGNPIHCDCAMSWTSHDTSPEIVGQCMSPMSEKKTPISKQERYHVCTFTGMECEQLPGRNTKNQPLRLWLRYRRAYRQDPASFNG